jgi:hypothetical protein
MLLVNWDVDCPLVVQSCRARIPESYTSESSIMAGCRACSWPVLQEEYFKSLISPTHLEFRHGGTSLEASTTGSASEQTETPRHELPSAAIILATPEADVQPGIDTVARQAAIDFGKGIPAIQVREEEIRSHLVKLNFIDNDPVTTEVLIRNLAFFQATVQAERLYRLIFGS